MKIVKVIQAITAVLAIVSWFSAAALFMHYDAVKPTKPDVSSGAIYAQPNHGHIVYLTAAEKHQWYWLMALAVILFVVAGVLYIHLALIKRSSNRALE